MNISFYSNLVVDIMLKNKEYVRCSYYTNTSLVYRPFQVPIIFIDGLLYAQQGNNSEALKCYQKAYNINKDIIIIKKYYQSAYNEVKLEKTLNYWLLKLNIQNGWIQDLSQIVSKFANNTLLFLIEDL